MERNCILNIPLTTSTYFNVLEMQMLIKSPLITPVLRGPSAQLLRVLGQFLFAVLLLGTGCAQGQAPNVTYSAPFVITQGGTYTGNYRSTDSSVPVIRINTTQPVILQNCTLVGPGDLINANGSNANLIIRECRGYGTTPTADNVEQGKFLDMYGGRSLLMEHNYLETNRGVVLNRWSGDGTPGQTIKMRYNRAYNLKGYTRNNTSQGLANFVILNTVTSIANMEIAWNQVINMPNQSRVEDNINFYDSGGTLASPARVHDNYVQGAYPIPATSTDFNGTGMTTDGTGQTAATSVGYLEIDHNQFVSTCNAGINVAAGHDVNVHDNRVVTNGLIGSTGVRLGKTYVGISLFNYYNHPASTFGNIRVADNVVGYVNFTSSPSTLLPNRYDYNIALATTTTGNVSLPNPVTVQTEQNEWSLWQQKLQQNNITAGLSGSGTTSPTTPPTTPPTPTPSTPTAPANATFYRAFSLNGGAQTIDNNAWEGGSATGLQVSGATSFSNQSVTLNPATDATRASMIRASKYGTQVQMTVSNVPSASYLVYLYVWEDNNPETFSVAVNGQSVQSNYNSGAAGHWDRLGPYATTASNGTITVATNGGTANCSGLEIWRANPAPTPAPAPTVTTRFYRAINLNGGAKIIDNNAWEGSSATNYAVNGISFANQGQQLSPATDASRASMLRDCRYSNSLNFSLRAVPNGTYLVSAYVWEDNNPEIFSLSVNGVQVQSNISTGAAGSWKKVGPFTTTATNGTIQLTTTGGTVNLSGVEVWSQTTSSNRSSAPTAATSSPSLYPNPLEGSLTQVQVEATLPAAESIQVQVLSSMGVQVAQATLRFAAGTSSQPLTVGSLQPGAYIVRFVSGSLAGTSLNMLKR